MEIIERIKAYLKRNNKHLPWAYGIMNEASDRAQTVWNSLSQEEKLAISRHNPFKADRNMIIKELSIRGIPQRMLCEISGLSMNVIKIITLKKPRKK